MRANVTAPTLAATIAIDRSARLRRGTVARWPAISRDSWRSPAMTARHVLLSLRASSLPRSGQGAACSRLVAMSARHMMIHKERKRLPVGLSVGEQFQADNARQNSLAARFQYELSLRATLWIDEGWLSSSNASHPESSGPSLSTPQNPAGSPNSVTRCASSHPVLRTSSWPGGCTRCDRCQAGRREVPHSLVMVRSVT
jgi:hypothetical protein